MFGSRGVGHSREGDGRVKETLLEVLTDPFRCGYKRLQEKESTYAALNNKGLFAQTQGGSKKNENYTIV